MKNVALFFGSFNPIHLGHINLANYIRETMHFDEVWYVISPQNPLKKNADLIDENERMTMMQLAIGTLDYIKICDIELSMPRPSYTIDTLNELKKKYPNMHFSLIIGSDNMLLFHKWKDYQQIIDSYEIVVYPRKGYNVSECKSQFSTMKIASNAPLFDISSTEIRALIAEKKDASKWLNDEVWQYILSKKLYS